MRWIRFSIVLLVLTLLNASDLLSNIAIGKYNIKPDFLLIALVFFAINCNTYEAIIASFAIGLCKDLSGTCMGPHFITFGILGSVSSQLRKVVIMKRMTHQGVVIFAMGIAALTLVQILSYFKIGKSSIDFAVVLLGTAAYSGLFGPVLWYIMSLLSGWLGIGKHSYRRIVNR